MVCPRWAGDTDFLPVVGQTRVLLSSCVTPGTC